MASHLEWNPTREYPDNFEMTIEEKEGALYITSLFGDDLKMYNDKGFKLQINDDGTAEADISNDNILRVTGNNNPLYAIYVFDEESGSFCDTWTLKKNSDGTVSVQDFYIASYTWDASDKLWHYKEFEAYYYDLVATRDGESAVTEMAQESPNIHVKNGVITLDEAEEITVYKDNGMVFYNGRTDRVTGLSKGMYIVCIGEHRKKVLVK